MSIETTVYCSLSAIDCTEILKKGTVLWLISHVYFDFAWDIVLMNYFIPYEL